MPVVKLLFSEVLTESFGFFFANLRLFFHIVTIPWIISLAHPHRRRDDRRGFPDRRCWWKSWPT